MRTHPIVEYYQALRDSAPCLSRAATLPKGTKLGLGKRRAPGNTIILSQPYRRRVSTDRLNREGSQLAASLEGKPGPTPAGKTLSTHSPKPAGFGGSGHEILKYWCQEVNCRWAKSMAKRPHSYLTSKHILNMFLFVSFCDKSQFDTNVVRHLSYFFI